MKKRRLEREKEKQERQDSIVAEQRGREREYFAQWESQEDSFHLNQVWLTAINFNCPQTKFEAIIVNVSFLREILLEHFCAFDLQHFLTFSIDYFPFLFFISITLTNW